MELGILLALSRPNEGDFAQRGADYKLWRMAWSLVKENSGNAWSVNQC
jgi:hypothetical protein